MPVFIGCSAKSCGNSQVPGILRNERDKTSRRGDGGAIAAMVDSH